jgi:glycosyltransferase involved in cell wall biosynthesis
MTRPAIRYYSMGDVSGYSIAAVGYVRGLVNAGVEVEWIRLRWPDDQHFDRLQVLPADCPLLAAGGNTGEGNFADVRTLAARTSGTIACGTAIAHLPPEMWPAAFAHAGGARRVGMTAWETDRPPAYWLSLLNQAERIVVPCRMNRDDFTRAGVRPPVRAVPHVRRHRHAAFEPAELAALRERVGIAAGGTVFYCIGAWDPRKAMPDLIEAFARAFRAGEPASLLLKTPATGYGEAPFHASSPVRELFAATCEKLARRLAGTLPNIVLLDGETDDLGIDMLHALGDCYVSLSHGEGWGLGAFDAAALGKPVVTAAWSAAPDYLAPQTGVWPGAIPHRLASAPSFPPSQPRFFPSQRWAQPDLATAAALMRRFHDDGGEMRAAAHAIREDILNRFAEPVVTRQLLEAMDG